MIALGQTPVRFPADTTARRTIPFDYAFRFELTGKRDTSHTQNVTVSIESEFTAVSMGYGLAPSRGVASLVFGAQSSVPAETPPSPTPPTQLALKSITIGDVIQGIGQALGEYGSDLGPRTADVLRGGLRLNPEMTELALLNNGGATLSPAVCARLFQIVAPCEEPVQFLYTLVDEGSGREFQSEPILNTAGLGISNGERPFRPFARPIVFAPMSTITMRITELSQFQGELHVSLQGYKTLGGANTPTSAQRRGRR